ncbi:MAG: M48 family metallopeptidase [Pseudohongiellaceae bacterium]
MKSRILFILLISLLAACTTSPTGRSQFMLISPEAAIAESQKAYISTVHTLGEEEKLLDDPLLADRVAIVTGRIVTVAEQRFPHAADWNWSVALIDDPETVNAWCMAGGRMAVYNGLLEKLELTDDEFAHIMGHEVSHALANHVAESMSIALASQLGSLAIFAATDDEEVYQYAELAAALAIELPNNRTSETEADVMGTELASLAGYDPAAAVTLWEKMEREGGARPLEFLSTHPSPDNRQANLASMIPRMRAIRPASMVPVSPVTIIQAGSAPIEQ